MHAKVSFHGVCIQTWKFASKHEQTNKEQNHSTNQITNLCHSAICLCGDSSISLKCWISCGVTWRVLLWLPNTTFAIFSCLILESYLITSNTNTRLRMLWLSIGNTSLSLNTGDIVFLMTRVRRLSSTVLFLIKLIFTKWSEETKKKI